MYYTTSWLVEGRVLLIESSGVSGVADWRTIQQVAYDAIETAGKPPQVHIIHQVLDHAAISNQSYRVAEVRSSIRQHPLIGWVIIVTEQPDPILRFIATIVAQILRQQFRIVPNMTDALELLKRLDASIDLPTINTG
jgi:hypothetical protein